ncbi:hypothetical protein G3R49_02380 [Shewanella sp. WXL01]|uniref:hypothetical protein n=1 Tax=Shewanella sp. WXL01 TaxID=2709721 RepID=UPI0014384A5B|nr:hypothetical protein [Shewanella sp. WXL01]NKF49428.1 hypothetical protein [Shewanella sp. WXL01]
MLLSHHQTNPVLRLNTLFAGVLLACLPLGIKASNTALMTSVNGVSQVHHNDGWRWGVGWNNYRGPSIGIGWSNGYYDPWRHNGWHDSYWGNDPWRWGYWRNRHWDNRYPYRERYRQPKIIQPKKIAPPQRVTTSISYDEGLHSLPANARVVIKGPQTFYEWQGVTYQYDWQAQRYMVVHEPETLVQETSIPEGPASTASKEE